jgi:hypothetical protein
MSLQLKEKSGAGIFFSAIFKSVLVFHLASYPVNTAASFVGNAVRA